MLDISASPNLLDSIFNLVPCHIFTKDLDGNYIACNKFMANDLGLPAPENIVGLRDSDLIWSKFSSGLRKNDSSIVKKKEGNIFVEPVSLVNVGLVELQSYKYPTENQSGVSGVTGLSFIRYDIRLNNASNIGLSDRQLECIKLLIQGLSMKEIGKRCSISHRTVETHIEAAKQKLNTPNKSSLIAACLQNFSHLFNN